MSAYRDNAKPIEIEDIFPKTFFERHPNMKHTYERARGWASDWAVGGLVIALLLVAFPGLYFLGGWFGNSIMGWGLGDIHQGPQRWVVGLLVVLAPIAVVFGPVWLGRTIKHV